MVKEETSKGIFDPPKLRIKMEGPKVGEGKLNATDLAHILSKTQQAIKRVAQVLNKQESQGKGRKKREIEEQCQLFLVKWEQGSAIAEIELAEPPAQLSITGYLGENSLEKFVQGTEQIAKMNGKTDLPEGFDFGVIQTCESIGKVLEHGINSISYESYYNSKSETAQYTKPVREKFQRLLGEPVSMEQKPIVGRLEILNGHGDLKGTLWEPDGTKWVCEFNRDQLESLEGAWMHNVKLRGRAHIEEGKENKLEVESIMILDEEVDDFSQTDATSFWKTTPIDELADQQDISPISDLDQLSALWPVDDDPDDLMNFVIAERKLRRDINQDAEND